MNYCLNIVCGFHRFKRSDTSPYQFLEFWFPQSFGPPSCHLRKVDNKTLDLKSSYFVYAVIVICLYLILDSQNNEFCALKFFVALETLVEIANTRSSLLHSFHQLHQEVEGTKEWKGSNSSGKDNLNSPYFICLLLLFWLHIHRIVLKIYFFQLHLHIKTVVFYLFIALYIN